jgi:hypothetical protein
MDGYNYGYSYGYSYGYGYGYGYDYSYGYGYGYGYGYENDCGCGCVKQEARDAINTRGKEQAMQEGFKHAWKSHKQPVSVEK